MASARTSSAICGIIFTILRPLITLEHVSSIALTLGIVTGGHDLLAGNNKNYIEWYNMSELSNGSLFLISDQPKIKFKGY